MKYNNWLRVIILFFISFFGFSCTSVIYRDTFPSLHDGKYDGETPFLSNYKQFEKLGDNVKLISSMAFYKTYIFKNESYITVDEINSETLKKAGEVEFSDKFISGTATVVYSKNGYVALLTCAHVVDFPDTLINYYADAAGYYSKYVYSISIKINQSNYIPELSQLGNVKVLISNKSLDIALIGKKVDNLISNSIDPFPYKIGDARELQWGTFVYFFGYPLNTKMMTNGIVSSPNKDKYFNFYVDAVLNRGFSGGLVLAIRDGMPNFELVGMVRSLYSDDFYYLTPKHSVDTLRYNLRVPYPGDIYINKRADIKYGVTRILSINAIQNFLKDNDKLLENEGYELQDFFKQHKTRLLKTK